MSEQAAAPETTTCQICKQEVPRATVKLVTTVKGRNATSVDVCPDCADKLRGDLEAQRPAAAHYGPAIVAGAVGGLAGAAVWTAIAAATKMEVGYVAVLVGFLCGVGVRFGAGQKRGQGLQIVSALLAVAALVVAKYGIFAYFVVEGAKAQGGDPSYFDPRIVGFFMDKIGSMFEIMDILFLALAIGAAYRVPAPAKVHIQD